MDNTTQPPMPFAGSIKTINHNLDDGDLYYVSDVHGNYRLLLKMLDEIGFKYPLDGKIRDRLVIVGDVIDRGPESLEALTFAMYNPSIELVLGNHEMMLILAQLYGSASAYHTLMANGGQWIHNFDNFYIENLAKDLRNIPSALEINVDGTKIGVVHAGVPDFAPWEEFKERITDHNETKYYIESLETPNPFLLEEHKPIKGIDVLVSGHMHFYPDNHPVIKNNQIFIDSGFGISNNGMFLIYKKNGKYLNTFNRIAFELDNYDHSLVWL